MTTARKNNDYSKSAINEVDQTKALCNPPETRTLYQVWIGKQKELASVCEAIENHIPENLKENRDFIENEVAETRKELETAIKTYGGFQDIEAGQYALLQGKKGIVYDAEKLKTEYPKLAQAVLIEVVNDTVLWALVKARTLDEKKLEEQMIVHYKKLPPAVIIR